MTLMQPSREPFRKSLLIFLNVAGPEASRLPRGQEAPGALRSQDAAPNPSTP